MTHIAWSANLEVAMYLSTAIRVGRLIKMKRNKQIKVTNRDLALSFIFTCLERGDAKNNFHLTAWLLQLNLNLLKITRMSYTTTLNNLHSLNFTTMISTMTLNHLLLLNKRFLDVSSPGIFE